MHQNTEDNHDTRMIIHIITSLNMGGTERFVATIAKHQSLMHPVEVLVLKEQGLIAREIEHNNITVHQCRTVISLYRHLRRVRPAIVHTHLFRANIIGRIIGWVAGVPTIISSQRSIDGWKRWWHWIIERITLLFADTVIANSYAAKNLLAQKTGFRPHNIHVVHNGFRPSALRNLKPPDVVKNDLGIAEYPMILYVGRMHHEKGAHYIPAIIENHIRQRNTDRYVLIGDGPLKHIIFKTIEEKNLSKYVIMLPSMSSSLAFTNACSIFFMPSIEESFSNAVLEAMACTKPVVATDVGGIHELIEHERNGMLVPPHKPESMAEMILHVMDHTGTARNLAKAAYQTATQFSQNAMLTRIDDIYNACLNPQKTSKEH
ncbi:MAG: glycosyltransferase [Elusimicrobia bacterium]|nr:glycosyltransferase [Elusimicrobiota bacterium]MBD3412157.1 glycosyltransferase [Elusimicrobiota bacterium]